MLAGARAARCSPSPAPARALFERIAVRALRLLPARRRIGWPRQGRQAASDPRRRAAQGAVVRSRRQLVNAAAIGRRREPPRAAADAALALAAARVGAAAAGGVVRAAGTGARQGAAADSRRHRHRLPRVEGRVGRLRDHRRRRAGRRHQGGRHAPAAGDERRAVAAAVHGRREPAAGRLHAEARGRRRRSRRAASSTWSTRRCRRAGGAHAQRADGRRPARGRRAAARRRSAIRSTSARCTATSRPTARRPKALTMEFEVATTPDAPALLNVDVPIRPVSETRAIFTKVMPVAPAAAGQVRAARDSLRRRRVDQDADARLRGRAAESADDVGGGLGDVVGGRRAVPAGRRRHDVAGRSSATRAVDETTLAPFRERVTPSVKTRVRPGRRVPGRGRLREGRSELQERDRAGRRQHGAAGVSRGVVRRRRATITRPPARGRRRSSTAPIFPQIYVWLGEALLRTHDFGGARAILEEAVGKWPSDARFTKPLAMLYGTFGRGREAVRTLERYLDDRQDDRDAYFLAVAVDLHRSLPAARSCTAAPRTRSAPTSTPTRTCEHEGRRRPSSSSGSTIWIPRSRRSKEPPRR